MREGSSEIIRYCRGCGFVDVNNQARLGVEKPVLGLVLSKKELLGVGLW